MTNTYRFTEQDVFDALVANFFPDQPELVCFNEDGSVDEAAQAVEDAAWRRGKEILRQAHLHTSARERVMVGAGEHIRRQFVNPDSPVVITPAGYIAMNEAIIGNALYTKKGGT